MFKPSKHLFYLNLVPEIYTNLLFKGLNQNLSFTCCVEFPIIYARFSVLIFNIWYWYVIAWTILSGWSFKIFSSTNLELCYPTSHPMILHLWQHKTAHLVVSSSSRLASPPDHEPLTFKKVNSYIVWHHAM